MIVTLWLVIVGVMAACIVLRALAARRRRRRAAQGPAKLAEHLERGRAKQGLNQQGSKNATAARHNFASGAIRRRRAAG